MQSYQRSQCLTFSSESSHSELHFFQGLMKNLKEQRVSGDLCDITLKVNNERVFGHKAVLGANSPYFYSMFTSDFEERSMNEIDLSASFSSILPLNAIIDFMYTGHLKLEEDILEETLDGATLFLMDTVRGYCAHYMMVNLGMHNVFMVWEIAEKYSFQTLAKVCSTFATEHLSDCSTLLESVYLVSETVFDALYSIANDICTLQEVCKVILNWIKDDTGSREKHLMTLLQKGPQVNKILQPFIEEILTRKDIKHSIENILQRPIPKPAKTTNKDKIDEVPATKENIIFHTIQENEDGQCLLDLFVHNGSAKTKWSVLPSIRLQPVVAHCLTHVIGFLGQKVVFGTVDGGKVKTIDLQTGEDSTISLLEEDGVTDIRRTILYSCFCFDHRLFCIEKNKNNYFFRCAYTLKQYNPALGMWSLVSELPLTDMEQRDEVEFQVRRCLTFYPNNAHFPLKFLSACLHTTKLKF